MVRSDCHLNGSSAQRFIQHFAVDRVLELVEVEGTAEEQARDPFVLERRFEQRFPDMAGQCACL